jgi:hypothetical protein
MKPIHSLLVIFAALIFAALAFAKGSRHDGVALGEQGRPVAGASIVVCSQPANVTVASCTPLANLYTDTTLVTPAPNPLTSDGLGNFHFYAALGVYTLQIYGPGINHFRRDFAGKSVERAVQLDHATNTISALTLNLAGSFNANFSPLSNAQNQRLRRRSLRGHHRRRLRRPGLFRREWRQKHRQRHGHR